jgi:hypothetical protein
MKRSTPIVGIATAASLIGAVVILATAGTGGAATSGLISDHALIDQTSGDTDVWCRSTNGQAFTIYGAFRAIGGDVTMRVTFKDADFVDYPIAQDTPFSFSEAAGGTPTVDKKIVVSSSGGAGDLVGWLSAARAPGSGSFVACSTN